jgi:Ni,Fe-hydrogenase III component G
MQIWVQMYDAKTMQIQFKYDANRKRKTMQIIDAIASNLHRHESEIRCKYDANNDANAMQIWVQMYDAKTMQIQFKYDANRKRKTMQIIDAIASNLHRHEREIRCKCDANYDANVMQRWVQIYDAKTMQIQFKYDANRKRKTMQIIDAIASSLHRHEREIRCKCDANYDANAMQIWVQMYDAKTMQIQFKYDANRKRKTMQIIDANTVQIRCKYDATGRCNSIQ